MHFALEKDNSDKGVHEYVTGNGCDHLILI